MHERRHRLVIHVDPAQACPLSSCNDVNVPHSCTTSLSLAADGPLLVPTGATGSASADPPASKPTAMQNAPT